MHAHTMSRSFLYWNIVYISMLAGGSSGSAMYCALQAAADYKLAAEHRVVVMLPDSIRNYMFVSFLFLCLEHHIWRILLKMIIRK